MNIISVVNVLSPLFYKLRYLRKSNPYEDFKKLREKEKFPVLHAGNVLLLPMRMAPVSNLVEGIYGYALRMRGFDVHGLFCGQGVIECENKSQASNDYINCAMCYNEQKKFCDAFMIEEHTYSIVDSITREKIEVLVEDKTLESLFSLTYDEVNLGIHIKSAVYRYYMSTTIDFRRHEIKVKQLAISTLMSYEATKKTILKTNPVFALSSHGVYSLWGGALEACKKLEVPVVVWARGYINGNILASHNESYAYEVINEPNENWENLRLLDSDIKKVEDYFLQKRKPSSVLDHVNYYSTKTREILDTESYLELPGNKMKFGLFPNIPWDGTTFSSSKAFPDVKSFIKTTIDWFIYNPDIILIVRAHPAEKESKYNKGQETLKDVIDSLYSILPENVIYLEPNHEISSYELERICETNLTYASTIGLEFAFFGNSVIQAGRSNTSNKGFIFECDSVTEYISLLERAKRAELKMTSAMIDRAKAYSYHWIFRRHMPEMVYNHDALTYTSYNIQSSMELQPGNIRSIDWFIDRCLDGKDFIWETNV